MTTPPAPTPWRAVARTITTGMAGLLNAMSGWRVPGAAAWQPSWPTDQPLVPPLIRIDHALHSDAVEAWRPRYVVVAGSDHKALVATFRAR